jgi:hypothetical protein
VILIFEHLRYFVKKNCLTINKTFILVNKYEAESVNRSQMDMKRKTCDIRNWKKYLYLDIYTIKTDDTLVPSLYQCA